MTTAQAIRVLQPLIIRAENYLAKREGPHVKSIESSMQFYRDSLNGLVQELLRGGHRLSKADFRRQMKALIKSSARDVFEEGWIEGGGDPEDTESDDIELLNDFTTDQQSYVNDFSDWLTDKGSNLDEAQGRMDSWAASMRNMGQQAKARAMGDPPLRFDGDDGEESCDECQEYKGQVHRRSWWENRGLTKRNGNQEFGCGRWENCHHSFFHARTGELIIG